MMATRESILIVANPTSCRGKGRKTALSVQSLLVDRGFHVDVRYTTKGENAELVTRNRCLQSGPPPDCVVACGGDGTIQEVVNALMSLREELSDHLPRLGIVPAGRCNDFARALGIPIASEDAANVLASGTARTVDLGSVNGRYFCTVATVGVDAEISSFVDRMYMPLRGTPAYVYGSFRVLCRYRSRPMRMEGDFGTIEQPMFIASCANTSSYGGDIRIAPDASPTDGLLDVCLIDGVSRLRSFKILSTILKARHAQLPEVRFLRTSRLTIKTDEPLDLWADGERIGQTPATILAVPDAINIVLPTDATLADAKLAPTPTAAQLASERPKGSFVDAG